MKKGWRSHIWIDGWHTMNATHETRKSKEGKIFSWIRWIHKALFAFSWFGCEKFFKYSFQWIISPNKNILGDWNFLLRSDDEMKKKAKKNSLNVSQLRVRQLSTCYSVCLLSTFNKLDNKNSNKNGKINVCAK